MWEIVKFVAWNVQEIFGYVTLQWNLKILKPCFNSTKFKISTKAVKTQPRACNRKFIKSD